MAKTISKQASAKVSAVPTLLKLLQSLLWYNDKYKLFFSTHHINNPQEYYFFMLDTQSGSRTHGVYRLTTEGMVMTLFRNEYKVQELVTMRKYDISMVQITNNKNELDYINWLGTELPKEKGKPYNIENRKTT